MVGETIALNAIQKIPTVAINTRRVVSPYTFYTCPAGFKAVIKGSAVCDGNGAAVDINLWAALIKICRWTTASCVASGANNKSLCLGTPFIFEIQLDAGDIVMYDQNTGTNAEIDFTATVKETPV